MKKSTPKHAPLLPTLSALALAFALAVGSPSVAAGEDDHAPHAETARGPKGGEVTQAGDNSVELLIDEAKGTFSIWVYSGKKPIPAASVKVQASLTRPEQASTPQALSFRPQGDAQVAEQAIEEPHFFEIEAAVTWPGQETPVRATLHKEEGLIALDADQVKLAGIELAVAGESVLETATRFQGEINFNADRTAHVVPRLGGVVQEVKAELGQTVKKGDLLATLSSTALTDLRGQWQAARKRLQLAAATHAREKQLWEEKVSAQQDYQVAQTALYEAQIAVQSAEQQLLAIGAKPQSNDLSRLEIRAPFDGVIVEKHITLGEALAESANIFTLSDLNTVWAEFVISARDLQSVRVGETAIVSSAAFTEQARGKVSYVGPLLGQQTRTATARVTLDNPEAAWRPGLFVTVSVVVEDRKVPIAIDADAVQTVEDKPTVFVEVPGGFLPMPVKLGQANGKTVEVTEGLRPGMRYASKNSFVLKSELGKSSAEHSH